MKLIGVIEEIRTPGLFLHREALWTSWATITRYTYIILEFGFFVNFLDFLAVMSKIVAIKTKPNKVQDIVILSMMINMVNR